MKFLKSKLALFIVLMFILALGLSGWGLAANRSSIKQVASANKVLLESLKAKQLASPTTQSPASNSSSSTASSSAKTNTGTSSTSKNSSTTASPPVLNDNDKAAARSDILAIHGDLEVYQTTNGYYPSDIAYSNFSAQGADQKAFTPPAGVHFVYLPSPSGCTTAAQNCMHYTLDALDSAGNAVTPQQKDLN